MSKLLKQAVFMLCFFALIFGFNTGKALAKEKDIGKGYTLYDFRYDFKQNIKIKKGNQEIWLKTKK